MKSKAIFIIETMFVLLAVSAAAVVIVNSCFDKPTKEIICEVKSD